MRNTFRRRQELDNIRIGQPRQPHEEERVVLVLVLVVHPEQTTLKRSPFELIFRDLTKSLSERDLEIYKKARRVSHEAILKAFEEYEV